MLWYSIKDITDAYNITEYALKHRIQTGILKAQKLQMGVRNNPRRNFKYIIPETELPSLAEFKLREPDASPNAQPDYYEKQRAEREEQDKQLQERWEEQRKLGQSYYSYLRSEEWQEKRRARLKLDGYRCQLCGSGTNLQVHHICYDTLRSEAEINDLVTLCHDCHQQVHSTDLERKESIPEGRRNSALYIAAVRALRELSMDDAWRRFCEVRRLCTPPLSDKECSKIWQSAVKTAFPL